MNYQEAQGKPEENVTYPRGQAPFMQKSGNSEPVTQVQRESVITREDVPNPIFRLGVTLVVVVPLLLVAAIYYGVIHP